MSFPHQLQGQYDDIAQEADLYKSQLNSERTSSKNLESLLQTNREKEFQSQLQSQEYGAEIQMLKDRLSLNDSKLWVTLTFCISLGFFIMAHIDV